MTDSKPQPRPDADTSPFWDGCREKILRFQRCTDCGRLRWPASFLCPECHGTSADWEPSSGRGKVYSYAVYHVAFHPGFREDLPYVVALVDLEEGPRILSNIRGCPPEKVHIEMPVELSWESRDDFRLPVFRPSDG